MKESIAIKKRLPVNLRKTLNSHSDPSSDAEYEDFVSYFCWRMAPKLLKLPEYDSLPEPTANPVSLTTCYLLDIAANNYSVDHASNNGNAL